MHAREMLSRHPRPVAPASDALIACIEACYDWTEANAALVMRMLEACADFCGRCADECERHAGHHEHCRICAEVCRTCERACLQAAKDSGATGP